MFGRMTLRKKIGLLMTVSVLIVAVAAWGFIYRNERRQIIDENSEMLTKYLDVFAEEGQRGGRDAVVAMYVLWNRIYPDGRLTLINSDGEVLFDSRANHAELDNHYKRPEIMGAFESGEASELRYSKTMGEWQNYMAKRFVHGGSAMAVRLSYPVSELEGLVGRMARPFLYSLEIILLLVWLGAYWMLRQIMRPLNSLGAAAEKIAEGGEARFPLTNDIEIQSLSNALNSMSDSLKLSAKEAQERREEMVQLISALPVGVILIDHERRLRYMNTAAARLCGKPDGVFHSGVSIEIVLPSDELCRMLGESDGSRLVRLSRGGGVNIEAVTLTLPRGRLIMLLDLTEKMRLDEARKEFFIDAGHEFQTPLTVIRAGLEVLKSGGSLTDEEDVKSVDTMLRQQERISGLVDDMLLLVRLESAPQRTNEETDLTALAEDVASDVRLLPNAAGIAISHNLPESALVRGGYSELRRALLNVVENGVKYVSAFRENGGAVDISIANEGEAWSLSVDDNGPGIADGDREKIFDRFSRGDKHRARGKDAPGGYGLGLAISKRIAERCGGSLALAESRLGGACFRFKLPKA